LQKQSPALGNDPIGRSSRFSPHYPVAPCILLDRPLELMDDEIGAISQCEQNCWRNSARTSSDHSRHSSADPHVLDLSTDPYWGEPQHPELFDLDLLVVSQRGDAVVEIGWNRKSDCRGLKIR
jgi:hypothetical protein